MQTLSRGRVQMLALLVGVVLSTAGAARAERFPVTDPTYRDECGSCHVPYPRRVLSADDWSRVLARLEKHFGTDASVDSTAMVALRRYLGAATPASGVTAPSGPLPRITDTRWFRHQHDEVPVALWQGPAVRSAANCSACHRAAANGDYRERTLRLPR